MRNGFMVIMICLITITQYTRIYPSRGLFLTTNIFMCSHFALSQNPRAVQECKMARRAKNNPSRYCSRGKQIELRWLIG